jgi:hypothetical protein
MFDETNHDLVEKNTPPEGLPVASEVVLENNAVPTETAAVKVVSEVRPTRYADAGRKGAARIHLLIRQGKLFEQEHGLKRGRQRLRQLIEEGKQYEQEHGLRPARKPRKRLGREQLLRTFLETLTRMVKPSYRQRLQEVLAALEPQVK